MKYMAQDIEQLGYDCGYTYLVGDRPELSVEEQITLASSLAEGCCSSLKLQQIFVTRFQAGYSQRIASR